MYISILLVSKGFHLSLSVALSENVQRAHKYITGIQGQKGDSTLYIHSLWVIFSFTCCCLGGCSSGYRCQWEWRYPPPVLLCFSVITLPKATSKQIYSLVQEEMSSLTFHTGNFLYCLCALKLTWLSTDMCSIQTVTDKFVRLQSDLLLLLLLYLHSMCTCFFY